MMNRLLIELELDYTHSDYLNDIVNMFGKYFGSVYSSPNYSVNSYLNNIKLEIIHLSKCTGTKSEVFDGLLILHLKQLLVLS